ncbi:MAG: septum formation protein Maf [Deltaproteobacteria bacterium]|nr:septum formation protein Maf [Deltaproteobacteria bacterium]
MSRGRLVLASASPRRKALLEAACFEVDVRAPHVDESWPGDSAESDAIAVARRKLDKIGVGQDPVVAADTLVMMGERRFGKPVDRRDAERMLRELSGRRHDVVTGFCVARGAARALGAVTTGVWFRRLADAEIDLYVGSPEPYDKAGGYAIQGGAAAFIDRIEGSFTNVMGLPMSEVLAALAEVGASGPES